MAGKQPENVVAHGRARSQQYEGDVLKGDGVISSSHIRRPCGAKTQSPIFDGQIPSCQPQKTVAVSMRNPRSLTS